MIAVEARQDIIANNIANVQTTRTPEGGAFRRQLTVFRGENFRKGVRSDKLGVRVKGVIKDSSPLRQVYDPSHPDASEAGYVDYPNIDLAVEMVNMISAQRAYEANIAVIVSSKRMRQKALEIIQR